MRSVELRNLAEHLRRHPEHAARVAEHLERIAADAAEGEARPVPRHLRDGAFAGRHLRLVAPMEPAPA